MQHWGVLTAADRWSDCMLVILEELRLVLLPSSHTEKARGEIKYSLLGVLIFMYIHCGEHFLKMNNHRRKGHRCAEVVHYGSGIIAFLTLVPIVMKSWQWPDVEWQITLWFNHASVGARVWVSAVGGVGVGHLPFLKKEKEKKSVSPPQSLHINHLYHFQSFLTNCATFIEGLCCCTLIVLKWELLSEESEWIEHNDL